MKYEEQRLERKCIVFNAFEKYFVVFYLPEICKWTKIKLAKNYGKYQVSKIWKIIE